MADQARLTRSRSDRVLSGVCGGLGKHLGIDPLLVRLAFLLLLLAGGIGLFLYLALAILVPAEDQAGRDPRETVKAGAAELGAQAKAAASQVAEVFRKSAPDGSAPSTAQAPPGEPAAPVDPPAPAGAPSPPDGPPPAAAPPGERRGGAFFAGLVLVLIGVWFLLRNLGLHMPWFLRLEALWPLVLVGLGAMLLLRRARR
ncbi:MAG TPA: PspC domain-containing protein [Myxococcota bacterium]|nr:PspC domain-containing protein [Myxococcota bacterium]HRY95293.1 PspC domain-containing protein [Myxococcota bacterium]HSA20882.1 PspC domain-containing protein [Myxococcota bacterium]